jgi:hypothetical protein
VLIVPESYEWVDCPREPGVEMALLCLREKDPVTGGDLFVAIKRHKATVN